MDGNSFSKAERLLKPDEFRRVLKTGKRHQTRNFTLCILANGLDRARLGISIGVAAGGAVERNRIKRLVREFFRLNKGRDAIPHSSDIVISVKKRTDLAGYRDVEEELKAAFIALTDSGAKKKPRQETP